MPELSLLCLEINKVPFVRVDLHRDPLNDLEAVSFETDDLLGIVCHEPHLSDPEIDKDLRADAIVPQVGLEPELDIRLDRVHALVLELICLELVHQTDTAAFLTHVEDDALAVLID